MKKIILFLLLFICIACSEWDRAAPGHYEAVVPEGVLKLDISYRSYELRLTDGKVISGGWSTGFGKSANFIEFDSGELYLAGTLSGDPHNVLRMRNPDGYLSRAKAGDIIDFNRVD